MTLLGSLGDEDLDDRNQLNSWGTVIYMRIGHDRKFSENIGSYVVNTEKVSSVVHSGKPVATKQLVKYT